PRARVIPYTFFLLLSRPPPTPTLFPYTTLFRSRNTPRGWPPSGLGAAGAEGPACPCGSTGRPGLCAPARSPPRRTAAGGQTCARSEEHTSELQSRFDLVCRLLLEKKNKKTIR